MRNIKHILFALLLAIPFIGCNPVDDSPPEQTSISDMDLSYTGLSIDGANFYSEVNYSVTLTNNMSEISVQYFITPSPPDWLVFSAGDGTLSGTTPATYFIETYTVSAIGMDDYKGSTGVTFTLEVLEIVNIDQSMLTFSADLVIPEIIQVGEIRGFVRGIASDGFRDSATSSLVTLNSVLIPASITSIGSNAFSDNASLAYVRVESATPPTLSGVGSEAPFAGIAPNPILEHPLGATDYGISWGLNGTNWASVSTF